MALAQFLVMKSCRSCLRGNLRHVLQKSRDTVSSLATGSLMVRSVRRLACADCWVAEDADSSEPEMLDRTLSVQYGQV